MSTGNKSLATLRQQQKKKLDYKRKKPSSFVNASSLKLHSCKIFNFYYNAYIPSWICPLTSFTYFLKMSKVESWPSLSWSLSLYIYCLRNWQHCKSSYGCVCHLIYDGHAYMGRRKIKNNCSNHKAHLQAMNLLTSFDLDFCQMFAGAPTPRLATPE